MEPAGDRCFMNSIGEEEIREVGWESFGGKLSGVCRFMNCLGEEEIREVRWESFRGNLRVFAAP